MTPKKILKLRDKIKARQEELGIIPVWDDRGHHYKFPDTEEYRSVTSKLQVVKDQGISNWYMNRACDHIAEKLAAGPIDNIAELIFEAKQAPVNEFQGAGHIGTAVHDWREVWMKSWIDEGVEVPPLVVDERTQVKSGCAGIVTALKELGAVPLACELILADKELKVGGMLDDLWAVPITEKVMYEGDDPLYKGGYKMKTKWEVWLVDLKTSNIGNKNSYYMQVAAYWHMFKKLYKIKVDKLYILHVSKTVFGKYELIELRHPERYWQMAKVAFKLSDDLEELDELKKPLINKI